MRRIIQTTPLQITALPILFVIVLFIRLNSIKEPYFKAYLYIYANNIIMMKKQSIFKVHVSLHLQYDQYRPHLLFFN